MAFFAFGKGVLNIAHRGNRSLAPENTLAAARKALAARALMWELDVCMTADGELLVLHDATLPRTSDVKRVFPGRRPWRVSDFTLEEIRRLDFGSWFGVEDPFGQIAGGAVLASDLDQYAREPAPTLREALAFTLENDWLVNVEIKDLSRTRGHATVVEKTVGLIEEMDMVERVLISSFNHAYLERARAANPAITAGALVDSVFRDPVSLLRRLGAAAYHPKLGAVGLRDIETLRNEGFEVLVWVANDEATMRSLIRSGVSGIFTDFPQLLAEVLSAEC